MEVSVLKTIFTIHIRIKIIKKKMYYDNIYLLKYFFNIIIYYTNVCFSIICDCTFVHTYNNLDSAEFNTLKQIQCLCLCIYNAQITFILNVIIV